MDDSIESGVIYRNTVLQRWVECIPMRMQSTLLLSLRGPDTHTCPEIKKIVRWMRGLTYKPGNPENVAEFMGEKPDRIVEKGPTAKELEFCTVHFYSHLMHGLEVLAYSSSVMDVRQHAQALYYDMCSLMHLEPEDLESYNKRLGPLEWPGGVQPNDYEEAVKMLKPYPFKWCRKWRCDDRKCCETLGHCHYISEEK